MKYQRPPVDAVQYVQPEGEPVRFSRDSVLNTQGSEAQRAWFEKDPAIKALREFVEGAKAPSGKPAVLGKTASWGRVDDLSSDVADFTVAVDTAQGTYTFGPGDWLIKDGDLIRIVKAADFAAQYKAVGD